MSLKIAVSACLLGKNCNFNGKDLLSEFVKKLPEITPIEYVPFCPEDAMFGSPRPNLRIVDGDGYDVLDVKARVINELNEDVTEQLLIGAKKFLDLLTSQNVNYAILMEWQSFLRLKCLIKRRG